MRILPRRLRVQALLLVAVGLGGAIIVAAVFAAARATPSASPLSSATVAATTGTLQTASPIAVAPAPLIVYYARQGLPPFRATALGGVPSRNSLEDRIGARLSALWGVQQPGAVPAGASNPFAKSGRVGSQGQLGTGVGIGAGLGRVGVDLRATGGVPGGRLDPRFTATLERCDPPSCDGGKWTLAVTLPDLTWPAGRPAYNETFDRSPIRSVRAAEFQGGTVAIAVRLDDARPWRVAIEPTGTDTARLYIDIGGVSADVNENIAVYLPGPDQGAGDRASGCTCRVRGAARVFEGSIRWRVRDGTGREVARGNAMASRGTGPVWGVFTTTITIPPAVEGQPTLEVFSLSSRDGSEQDLIRIPLTLH